MSDLDMHTGGDQIINPGEAFMGADLDALDAGGAETPAAEEAPAGDGPDHPADPAEAANPLEDSADEKPEPDPEGDDPPVEGGDPGRTPPAGELKRANDQAARYRTQLRAFEQVVAGYGTPENQNLILRAVHASGELYAAGNGAQAAEIFREVAALLEAESDGASAPAAGGVDDAGEYVSRAEVAAMLAKGQQEQAYEQDVAQAQQAMFKTATDLGYDPRSEDPSEVDRWGRLLYEAITFHDSDIQAAHEAQEERVASVRQQAIDEFMAGKTKTAVANPEVADGPSPAPAAGEAPKDFLEARDGLERMLAAD